MPGNLHMHELRPTVVAMERPARGENMRSAKAETMHSGKAETAKRKRSRRASLVEFRASMLRRCCSGCCAARDLPLLKTLEGTILISLRSGSRGMSDKIRGLQG